MRHAITYATGAVAAESTGTGPSTTRVSCCGGTGLCDDCPGYREYRPVKSAAEKLWIPAPVKTANRKDWEQRDRKRRK